MEESLSIGLNHHYARFTRTALIGQKILATDSDILMIGGYYSGKQPIKASVTSGDKKHVCSKILDFYSFNFASGQWTNIITEGIPSTRIWSSVHLQGRQLFIYGGTGYPFGQMLSNNLKVLDLNSVNSFGRECSDKLWRGNPTWNLIETNASDYNCLDSGDNAPPRGYRQNMIFHEGNIYVYGGVTSDGYISDMHKLNFVTTSWEKLTPTGIPPVQPAQFLGKDAKRFYVIGFSENIKTMSFIMKIWSYIFSKNHWEVINTIPDLEHGPPNLRLLFAVSQTGSDAIISGGMFNVNHNVNVYHSEEQENIVLFNDIWRFDLETYQWHKLNIKLCFPTYEHSTVISPDGYLCIYGGNQKSGYHPSESRVYKLRLSFLLPTLAEQCWGKLVDLFNRCHHLEKDKIQDLGVPWSYLKRIH